MRLRSITIKQYWSKMLILMTLSSGLAFASDSVVFQCPSKPYYLQKLIPNPLMQQRSRLVQAAEQLLKTKSSSVPVIEWDSVRDFMKVIDEAGTHRVSKQKMKSSIELAELKGNGKARNDFIFFYEDEKRHHALKVLKLEEPQIETRFIKMMTASAGGPPDLRRQELAQLRQFTIDYAREIRNADLAEKFGGAKFYGSGLVKINEKPRFYI